MKETGRIKGVFVVSTVAIIGCLILIGTAWAHCDTTNGPIIPEARLALERGDVTPMLKWVKKDGEAEIKAAFARAVAVRGKGPEARDLADYYFLETLIRVHRAGEGAPYTGIKDEPVEPIAAMADKALADGSAAGMIEKLNAHAATAIREKFNRVLAAKQDKDKSVEAGREYVEAYVIYVHYIEGVHAAITAAGGHQHGPAAEDAAPSTPGHKGHKE